MKNTLNDKLDPYIEPPTILNSIRMGPVTEPSLYHSEALEVILFLFKNPWNSDQTVVLIHKDKHPFTKLQTAVIPYGSGYATFSIDRRSIDEQREDRSIFVGLTYDNTGRNRVAKLQFEGATCQELVNLSEEVQAPLFRCHTMRNDLHVAFYA